MTAAAPSTYADASVQRNIARRLAKARAARSRPPVNVAPVPESHEYFEVLGRAGSTAGREALWSVRCRRCETVKRVRGKHLRDGRTKSCGCLQREIASITRKRCAFRRRSALWFRRKGEE